MTDNEPEPAAPSLKQTRELRQMLDALPGNQREVLRLRVEQGRSTAETATVLGTTAERVRETQHAALQALRELARKQQP